MSERNKSELILKANDDTSIQENISEFYRLHYWPKKSADQNKNSIGFRARSVNTIITKNPQEESNPVGIKHKKSLKDKIKDYQKSKQKMKEERKKVDKFSFKQVLSKQYKSDQIKDYFSKFGNKATLDIEEYGKNNVGVKLAIQKCKDQKIKIKKVISSSKQTEETKLDYLELKKQDIENQIKNQIKVIYQEFFKKQYQDQGSKGFKQFEEKIRFTMDILHQQMFGGK